MPKFSGFTLSSFQHPEVNEDAYFIDQKNLTAGVFDGMGGHAAGDIASQLTCQTIKSKLAKLKPGAEKEVTKTILEAFELASRVIKLEIMKNPQYLDMGTTGSVVKILSLNKIVWANIGDSRIYLKRKGQPLIQLTQDDSYVQELVNEGKITPQEAEIHPLRNLITKVISARFQPPKINLYPIKKGDLILICSDGVHDNLTNQEIEKELPNPEKLVKKAYQVSQQTTIRSKPDDITAIVIEI